MKKKMIVLLAVFFLLSATGAVSAANAETGQAGQAAFAGGVLQPMPDITGTRLKVTRSYDPIKPPDNNNLVAIAYYFLIYDDGKEYYGHCLNNAVTTVNENKTVYGRDRQRRDIRFELPAMLSTDIDMYWFGTHLSGDYRVIFDKEKNIVMTLADSDGDLLVAAYRASGLALKDVTYLGSYRYDGQPKLIVSDEFRVYVVDAKTMRNEREYDLQGLKAIGVTTGLRLEKSASRLGVWLISRDNRMVHYLDLPTGEIRLEADLAQYDIAGEFVKVVSGWSGYITGGYGGVFLVKNNQNYSLYDSRFKRRVDQYPHGGKPLGDVKDIHWAIVHGVRTRAAVVVIEREGPYLVNRYIEAKEFFE